MPAPTELEPIDKEAVRTLAVAIGVREAARKLGLSEDRVRQWSFRGEWFKQPAKVQQPPTVTKNDVTSVTKPADALANALAEAGLQTRLGLSKATLNAAKSFSNKPGDAVIKASKALLAVTTAAAKIHGWEERKDSGLTLQLGVSISGMQ